MKPNEIISVILIRYKNLCEKYPQASSFSSENGISFYVCQKRSNNIPVQIRISDHGTYLKTWVDRHHLEDSTKRLYDPAHCINISIVFTDEDNGLTYDCEKRANCDGCKIEPCIPQTFEGQNELGKPFKVIQYVYNSRYIASRYINGITKAIMEARLSGEYKDPLINLYRAASSKEFSSNNITENKQYNTNTMNNTKKRIRLTEADLHKLIKESVKTVLNERHNPNSEIMRALYALSEAYDRWCDEFDEEWGDEGVPECYGKYIHLVGIYISRIKSAIEDAEGGAPLPAHYNGIGIGI